MTEEEIKQFCDRFMPSYEAYMDNLTEEGFKDHVSEERTLKFFLNEKRQPYIPSNSDLPPLLAKRPDLYANISKLVKNHLRF